MLDPPSFQDPTEVNPENILLMMTDGYFSLFAILNLFNMYLTDTVLRYSFKLGI